MKLFKKKEYEVNAEMVDDLEMNIISIGQILAEAEAKLAIMDPEKSIVKIDDGNGKVRTVILYKNQADVIDSLSKDYENLMKMYQEIKNPRTDANDLPFYKRWQWDRLLQTAMVIAATILSNVMLFNKQQQGHVISKEISRMQMPRPM